MTLARALLYFCREAAVNLGRSWKISLIAVSAIAVSLFIGGTVLLVTANLERLVSEWRREAKVVVYLGPGVPADESSKMAAALREAPWVTELLGVSGIQARRRFAEYFPSVADVVEAWGGDALPASFELTFDPDRVDPAAFDAWIGRIRGMPGVEVVDDDRDWVAQLDTVVQVGRGVGLALVGVLLLAATFTIASVIRLTAYLYRDEIGIMRLVGATELFIRGPFYLEGVLQGLVGGALAIAGLYAGFAAAAARAPSAWLAGALTGSFLSVGQQALLIGLGALAGLVGSVVSLRRETV